jgi:hypothetical protein
MRPALLQYTAGGCNCTGAGAGDAAPVSHYRRAAGDAGAIDEATEVGDQHFRRKAAKASRARIPAE